jgi:hypothetical protein
LIIIPTQSLRFDTLSIALSYKDSFYCEWLISLLIYFGKKKTTLQGFHLSEHFQKTLHCEKDRRFQIPCQPSGRRVIPFGRPYVHYSIRPDDVFILTGRQTDHHHPSGRRIFPSGPFTVSRSFCSSLHPSGPLSSPSG